MRVVVPYVEGMLHPKTVPAIEAQGYEAVLEELTTANEGARYPRLLLELFQSDEDFCIIEHDIQSRTGFLDGLRDCPEPWCFHAYSLGVPFDDTSLPYSPLGHTRFRSGLWPAVRELADDPRWGETWVARDAYLGWHLLGQGFKPHRHPGDVPHFHRYHEEHPSDEWNEIQNTRLRTGDPRFPTMTFRCQGCQRVLRTERSSTIRVDTEMGIEPYMCPVCADDPELWEDWRMPV